MKKQSQDQTNEQLHIDDAAAAQEEYSLEDIMNEFGGWSKKEEAAPKQQAQTPPDLKKPPQKVPESAKPAPETKVVRFPKGQPIRAEGEPKEPKNPADFKGQTIRFTPIREDTAPEEKPKIWTYQAEPDPEPVSDDPKEAKKAAQRARRAEKEAKKRQKQLERHQKQQAKRMERRKEQPEREFPDCRAAYTYYAQGTFQRLRLFLSILLALVSGALAYLASYSLGSYDFTANADVFSKVLLIIMVVQAFIAFDVMLRGVRAVMRLRYDHASMLVVLTLACAVDAVLAIRAGRIPFCPAVTLQLSMALLGEYSMQLAKVRTLKAACSMNEPKAAVREEKAWHGEDCIFRSEGHPETFVRELEIPDAGSRIMRIYAPILTLVTLGLSVLSMLQAEDSFLWAWTALMIASFPVGIFLSFSRPFAAQARRLSRAGAAIGGWFGARMLGGEAGIAIEDADLFPPQNVTLNGMKIYSDRSVSQIIGFANAVVQTAGSGLAPLFEEIMHNQNGRHYGVDTFRRYEGGGLGAEIRGDVILMGSLGFMKLMRVHMPEGARVKQAVYLSVNGELAAVFALSYAPATNVKASLQAISHCAGLTPILATRDFMITPQFLKHRYKLSPDRIEFPTVEERARLSSQDAIQEPKQGALLSRPSFACFSMAVAGARAARSAAIAAIAVAFTASIMGLLVLFFLTFIGSTLAVSSWNLLLYTILWLLPELLITSMAAKR
ncbi:hypothetical protein [Oscillospiraceae bacterium]|nr:hypothetical protein [Oscillospiraceae bacterium]